MNTATPKLEFRGPNKVDVSGKIMQVSSPKGWHIRCSCEGVSLRRFGDYLGMALSVTDRGREVPTRQKNFLRSVRVAAIFFSIFRGAEC